MVKSLKAFKLKFINVADFLKKKIPKQFLVPSSCRSEYKITCVLCSVLNLRLKKLHSFFNKNLSYKKVKVEVNQNSKNEVRTISRLNSFYFAQFLFIRVTNNFNTRQHHRSHLKSDVSSRQLTSYGKENLLTPERTFAVTNRKKHINNITKFF